jgi:hypothetical protein
MAALALIVFAYCAAWYAWLTAVYTDARLVRLSQIYCYVALALSVASLVGCALSIRFILGNCLPSAYPDGAVSRSAGWPAR